MYLGVQVDLLATESYSYVYLNMPDLRLYSHVYLGVQVDLLAIQLYVYLGV